MSESWPSKSHIVSQIYKRGTMTELDRFTRDGMVLRDTRPHAAAHYELTRHPAPLIWGDYPGERTWLRFAARHPRLAPALLVTAIAAWILTAWLWAWTR